MRSACVKLTCTGSLENGPVALRTVFNSTTNASDDPRTEMPFVLDAQQNTCAVDTEKRAACKQHVHARVSGAPRRRCAQAATQNKQYKTKHTCAVRQHVANNTNACVESAVEHPGICTLVAQVPLLIARDCRDPAAVDKSVLHQLDVPVGLHDTTWTLTSIEKDKLTAKM